MQIGNVFYTVDLKGVQALKSQINQLTRQIDAATKKPLNLGGAGKGLSNDARAAKELASALNQAKIAQTGLSRAPKPNLIPKGTGSQAKQLRNEILGLRSQFIALGNTGNTTSAQTAKFTREMAKLRDRSLAAAKGLDRTSAEFRQLNTAAATAQRSITGATGKMSRLGLASQTTVGTMNALRSTLLSVGFAASSTVAGTALITAGFASANAGAKSFIATLSVIAPLIAFGAAIASSFNQIRTLERAQVDVAKVTDLTKEEIGELTSEMQDLSTQLGISAQDLLATSASAGRLGVEGRENISEFTRVISELSIATDVIGEQGAESLAKFLAQTGTATEDIGRVSDVLGDVLNELGNQLPTTAGRVLEFTRFTGRLGAFANVTREDILGLSAGFESLGLRAEGVGNPLFKIFAQIQNDVREGKDTLEIYTDLTGLTIDQFKELATTNVDEAFRLVAKGLNEVKESGGDVNGIIKALNISEARQTALLAILSKGYDTYAKSLEIAQNRTLNIGSRAEEVNKQLETLNSLIDQTREEFSVISQELGIGLLPAFKAIVSTVGTAVGAFGDLPPILSAATLGVTALGIALRVLSPTLFAISAGLAGLIAVDNAIKGIIDRSQEAKGVSDELRPSIEALADSISNIERPAQFSSEALNNLRFAAGPEQLQGALNGLTQTMSVDAQVAFEQFTGSVKFTAASTTQQVAMVFNFLAQARRQVLQDSLAEAKILRDQISSQVQIAASSVQDLGELNTGGIFNREARQQLEFAEQKLGALGEQFRRSRASVADFQAQVDALGPLKTLEEQYEALGGAVGANVDALRDHAANSGGGGKKGKGEVEELKGAYDQLTDAIKEAEEELQNAAASGATAEQLKPLQENLETLKAELKAVDDLLASLGASSGRSLSTISDQLQRANEALQDATSISDISAIADTILALEEEKRQLEGIFEQRKLIAEFQRTGADQERLAGLFDLSELEAANQELSATQGLIESLNSLGTEQAQAAIDNLTGEFLKLKGEVESLELQEAFDEFTKGLTETEAIGAFFGDDAVKIAREQLQAVESELRNVLGQLNEDLTPEAGRVLSQQFSDLRGRFAELKQEVETLETGSIDALSREISNLQAQFSAATTTELRRGIQETINGLEQQKNAVLAVFELDDIASTLNESLGDISRAEGLNLTKILFGDDEGEALQQELAATKSALSDTLAVIGDLEQLERLNALTDEQAGLLAVARANVQGYTASINGLNDELRAIEFPVGSLRAFDEEISKARDAFDSATTDNARQQAQDRIDIAEDEKEEILDRFRTLKEELADLAEQQDAELTALVSGVSLNVTGASFDDARATINEQLAQARLDLGNIDFGSLSFGDLDNDLLVTFNALTEEIERLEGALSDVNDADLEQFNQGLAEIEAQVRSLTAGIISAEDQVGLDAIRTDLLRDLRGIKSDIEGVDVNSPAFALLQEQLAATLSLYEQLPPRIGDFARAAQEANAAALGFSVPDTTPLSTLTSLVDDVRGVTLGFEEDLDKLAITTELFGDRQTEASEKVDLLKGVVQSLVDAGLKPTDPALDKFATQLRIATADAEKLTRAIEETNASIIGFEGSTASDNLEGFLETLAALEDVSPELAAELDILGIKTSDYNEKVLQLLPLLEAQLALIEDPTAYLNFANAIAELRVQATSLLDSGFTFNDLTVPDDSLRRIDQFNKLISLSSDLTPQAKDALEELGVEILSNKQANEGLIEALKDRIEVLKTLGVRTEDDEKELEKLRVQLAKLQGDIAQSNETLVVLSGTLEKLASVADVAGGVLDSVFDANFSNVNSALDGISGIAGAISAVPDALGLIPGPIGTIASSISTVTKVASGIFGNFASSLKKDIAEINDSLNFIDFTDIATTERKSVGGLFGLLGTKKTELDKEASALALSLAQTIDQGFTTGLSNAFDVAVSGGDVLGSLEQSLDEIVFATTRQALINSLIVDGALGEQITAYAKAVANGNKGAAAEILTGIREQLPGISEVFDSVANGLGVTFGTTTERAVDKFGVKLTETTEDAALNIGQILELTLSDAMQVVLDRINEVDGSSIDIDVGTEAFKDLFELREGLNLEFSVDNASFEALQERLDDLNELNSILADTGIELTQETVEAINQEIESITNQLESITGITTDSITGGFANAITATGSFLDAWEDGLNSTTANAVANAFANNAANQAIISEFTDSINEALSDGTLTQDEVDVLAEYRDRLGESGENLNKILKELGLIKTEAKDLFTEDSGTRQLVDDLAELQRVREELSSGGESSLLVDGVELTVSEDDLDAVNEAIQKVTDNLKSTFGVAVSDFSSAFSGAITNVSSVDDFLSNWRDGFRDTTKNALIASFTEGELIQGLFEDISDSALAALKDGVLTPDELTVLEGYGAEIEASGQDLFTVLEGLGLITDQTSELAKELAGLVDSADLDERALQVSLDLGEIDQNEFLSQTKALQDAAAKQRFEDTRAEIEAFRGKLSDDLIDEQLAANARELNIELSEIKNEFLSGSQDFFLSTATFDELRAKAAELRESLAFSEDSGLASFANSINESVRSLLGIASSDLASGISTAFSESEGSYRTFTEQFGLNLEDRLKTALFRSVLESQAAKTLSDALSSEIDLALEDGQFSQDEITNIQARQEEFTGVFKPLFDQLEPLNVFGDAARESAKALEEQEKSAKESSKAFTGLTQSITNAPSGFKIERFIQESVNSQGRAPFTPSTGRTDPQQTSVTNVNFNQPVTHFSTDDLQETVVSAVDQADRDRALNTGVNL